MHRKIVSDEEFMAWAESFKPCKYCDRKFYGPVCECEMPLSAGAKTYRTNKRNRD